MTDKPIPTTIPEAIEHYEESLNEQQQILASKRRELQGAPPANHMQIQAEIGVAGRLRREYDVMLRIMRMVEMAAPEEIEMAQPKAAAGPTFDQAPFTPPVIAPARTAYAGIDHRIGEPVGDVDPRVMDNRVEQLEGHMVEMDQKLNAIIDALRGRG